MTNRNWTQAPDTVGLSIVNVIPDGLPAEPKSYADFGITNDSTIIDPSTSLYTIIQGGPNDGVAYFLKPPVSGVIMVHVDSEALQVGSPFDTLQAVNPSPDSCARGAVKDYFPLVQAHEGVPPNPSPTTSHSGVFRYQLNKLIPSIAETLKAIGDLALYDSLATPMLKPLIDSARNVARDSAYGGIVPPISFCRFRFFPN